MATWGMRLGEGNVTCELKKRQWSMLVTASASNHSVYDVGRSWVGAGSQSGAHFRRRQASGTLVFTPLCVCAK